MGIEWRSLLCVFFLLVPGARGIVPWVDGQEEIYEVHWGVVVAAEAKLTVGKGGRGWESVLALRSRGMVDALYPIGLRFVSQFNGEADRSFGLEVAGIEGEKNKHERLTLEPERQLGRLENVLDKSVKEFPIPPEGCQDMLSMLYATRAAPWVPGMTREWEVCENRRIKRVGLKCEKEETIEDTQGVEKACLVLVVEELPDREGRAPKKPLKARIWMDKATAIPVKAELRAIFGTFRLTRVMRHK